jgi:sensor histidine kinase YesM
VIISISAVFLKSIIHALRPISGREGTKKFGLAHNELKFAGLFESADSGHGNHMKEKSSLRRRFMIALVFYSAIILALLIAYQNIARNAIRLSTKENAILAADDLNGRIGAEFSQMRTITAAIAGSSFVKDFLNERNTQAFYEKAVIVSEIILKAAFPVTNSDSIISFGKDGNFYRFSGGLSHDSCEELYRMFGNAGTVYTVIELDGTMFFCHNAPVFDSVGQQPLQIGNIVMLTGLDKTRRMLIPENIIRDIDMAVIFDGEIILSNNMELEGMSATGIEPLYGVVSLAPVAGTTLTVAAAISDDALFPENTLFLLITVSLLCLLLGMIVVLYNYLSGYMIRPMASIIAGVRKIGGDIESRLPETGKRDFDALVTDINAMLDRTKEYNDALAGERQKLFDAEMARQNMRMSLLASQMDAHFVVNTLMNIRRLADMRESEKTGQMADGLAAILQYLHAGDALVNVFDDFLVLGKYIEIMNIKFNGKFIVEDFVDDRLLDYKMPGFILQPIVENAFVHGLGNQEKNAKLIIKGFLENGNIVFEITDNGKGILDAKLNEIRLSLAQTELSDFPKPGLRGVALVNAQRRILIQCGEGYGITVASDCGKGTKVTVTLPQLPDN